MRLKFETSVFITIIGSVIACILFTGVFQGSRLIIVVTKFDCINEHSDTDDEITDEHVKEQTCQIIRKACPGAKISHDDVLLVSGWWAYNARMLANTGPQLPTHYDRQAAVKKCLHDVSNLTCGQGENPDKLTDKELSDKLEEASGIGTLEARYSKIHVFPRLIIQENR